MVQEWSLIAQHEDEANTKIAKSFPIIAKPPILLRRLIHRVIGPTIVITRIIIILPRGALGCPPCSVKSNLRYSRKKNLEDIMEQGFAPREQKVLSLANRPQQAGLKVQAGTAGKGK